MSNGTATPTRTPSSRRECHQLIASCDSGLIATGRLWATATLSEKVCGSLKRAFLDEKKELELWLKENA